METKYLYSKKMLIDYIQKNLFDFRDIKNQYHLTDDNFDKVEDYCKFALIIDEIIIHYYNSFTYKLVLGSMNDGHTLYAIYDLIEQFCTAVVCDGITQNNKENINKLYPTLEAIKRHYSDLLDLYKTSAFSSFANLKLDYQLANQEIEKETK